MPLEILMRLLRPLARGFCSLAQETILAGGNNAGLVRAPGAGADAVMLLNNDTLPDPGLIEHLLGVLERDPSTEVRQRPGESDADAEFALEVPGPEHVGADVCIDGEVDPVSYSPAADTRAPRV